MDYRSEQGTLSFHLWFFHAISVEVAGKQREKANI